MITKLIARQNCLWGRFFGTRWEIELIIDKTRGQGIPKEDAFLRWQTFWTGAQQRKNNFVFLRIILARIGEKLPLYRRNLFLICLSLSICNDSLSFWRGEYFIVSYFLQLIFLIHWEVHCYELTHELVVMSQTLSPFLPQGSAKAC